MPFEKTGKDQYRSPSGRKYTGKQVRMYHANDGFPEKGVKKVAKAIAKKGKHRVPGY